MIQKRGSALQQIREARGLSRKELSEKSGINFRSLQDYEQGHKEISSAKGETLLRLSLALGCNMEDLLQVPSGNAEQKKRLQTYYQILTKSKLERIEWKRFYSEKYQTYARLKIEEENYYLTFCYKGEIVKLPFEAKITETTLPWLEDVVVLMMNSYLRNRIFEDQYTLEGGERWDES